MNIGIVSHINPFELREYLYKGQDIPNNNCTASSVHALIAGLLEEGNSVVVFCKISVRHISWKTKVLNGDKLKVYLIPHIPRIDFYLKHLYLPRILSNVIRKEVNNLDVLHAQWTYENAVAASRFVNMRPVFCSVRDWFPAIYEFSKSENFSKRWMWSHANRLMFKQVISNDKIHFVANSEYTKQRILSVHPEYVIPIIPNPINEKFIAERKPFQFNNTFISVSSSIFDEGKNIYKLLVAYNKFRNEINSAAKLILVGGYSKDDIRYHKWEDAGLFDGVELMGALPHHDVLRKMDDASVLIHPSTEETFGNVLLEGMARRLLIVGGKNSGAVPSVLGYGQYGLLCDVTNIDSIYSTIKQIFDKGDESGCIVDQASCHLENDLTGRAIARLHLKMYHNCLA